MILIKYISTTFLAHYFMSWLPCKQRLHFYCVSWRVKSSLCRQLFNFSTVHARNLSCDSQAKLIVSCVVKWCEFWGNKEISPTLICYARWVQDSHSAPNRSRTGKSLFFKFILPDFWMSLNGCRQRLLFAHWLTQRKCSLCLQGMSWQVASINISANQNTRFVMDIRCTIHSTNISGNFFLKLNEMVFFGSVLWKYLGSPVKVVLFGLQDWSDWNFLFHSARLLFLRTACLFPAHNITDVVSN